MVSRDTWHKYSIRKWCFKIVRNIFGELGNNKSSIYTKYPEETILLCVYNTRPRKYSSVMRGESFCCIWSLPRALLVWRTCLPLNIFAPFFLLRVFVFSIFFEFLNFFELDFRESLRRAVYFTVTQYEVLSILIGNEWKLDKFERLSHLGSVFNNCLFTNAHRQMYARVHSRTARTRRAHGTHTCATKR